MECRFPLKQLVGKVLRFGTGRAPMWPGRFRAGAMAEVGRVRPAGERRLTSELDPPAEMSRHADAVHVSSSPSRRSRDVGLTCPLCTKRFAPGEVHGVAGAVCPSCGAPLRSHDDSTRSWHTTYERALSSLGAVVAQPAQPPPQPHAGFTPKLAINPNKPPDGVVRGRLRTVALLHLLAYGGVLTLTLTVLKDNSLLVSILNTIPLAALGSIIYLLSGRRPLSAKQLKTLELGMFCMLACLLAFYQYRAMLEYSLRGNSEKAHMVMRNAVLGASVLILTYAFYVPKNWRRAALVGGPLALLPGATLLVLFLRHPHALGWIGRGSTSLTQIGTDIILLQIFAIGSAYGAHTIYRLRRQIDEARQLGQYALRRRIGAGGMGEVYLAEHQLLKRPCALKLIRPGLADAKAMKRFEREVMLTATLSHPNTVEIYDYGRTNQGVYYYVMEYLPGLSLAELVERTGPLPPERVVYLVRQVCGALREAHAAGLIHRDIKPANIFAARRGGMDDFAKLLDFGLVQDVAETRTARLSGEGRVVGTPSFMSPEQATRHGRGVDERSDIYSLGAVIYYLLTGRPPFEGRGGIELIIAHARDPVPPPSKFYRGIPTDLEEIVLQCLAKDPADRFPDAESLDHALAGCACASAWDDRRAARWWLDAYRTGELSTPPRDGPGPALLATAVAGAH